MRKLRIYFLLVFLALAIPYAVLLRRSYANLDEESYFFYRRSAESVISSVAQQLTQRLQAEADRSYTEYRYIHVPERPVPNQEGLNVSPLAAFPVQSNLPGVLGYFQIDPDGSFHTPLLPSDPREPSLEVPMSEQRRALQSRLREIVESAGFPTLARSLPREELETFEAPASPVGSEDRLRANLASNTDVRLQNQYLGNEKASQVASSRDEESRTAMKLQQRRLEPTSQRQAQVFDDRLQENYRKGSPPAAAQEPAEAGPGRQPEVSENRLTGGIAADEAAASLVSAEVDPFQVQVVGRGWLILERKVWWNDRRYIQGLVARLEDLAGELIEPALLSSALPTGSGFLLFHDGEMVLSKLPAALGSKPLLLENAGLPAPFSNFNLALTVERLPPGPGRGVVNLIAVLAAVLIVGGIWGAYRLTATQWQLSRKQADFVSAISHELKSPLTSIRMYGEMLMEGWVADEEKRKTYYRQIHDESERLSRLIQNVLRLAQLERGQWQVKLVRGDPHRLLEQLIERLRKPVNRAGFEIQLKVEGSPGPIQVDRDALTQILINLTDNAVKFAAEGEPHQILIRVMEVGRSTEIRVRDFGPGIPRGERKRIFQQFYRVGREMTRSTQGTGLGLSLVKMLTEAMGGRVEVSNQTPGAEFRLIFPQVK